MVCRQRDFLPFSCDRCRQVFCLAHRTPESHNCVVSSDSSNVMICPKCNHAVKVITGVDPQTTLSAHQRSACYPSRESPPCPVSGCDKKLTESGSVVCPSCRKRVCLVHRYEDSHNCIATNLRPVSPGRAHGTVPDWKCTTCKSMNLGTSYRCSKCHTPRSPDSPISGSPKSRTNSNKSKNHKCIIS